MSSTDEIFLAEINKKKKLWEQKNEKIKNDKIEITKEQEASKDLEDKRPLYERLKEQKILEEEKYKEKARLGNYIRKLDDDEFEYLEELRLKEESEREANLIQDELELRSFRENQVRKVDDVPATVELLLPQSKKQKIKTPLVVARKKIKKKEISLVDYGNE